jgi:hypothetical protein
VRPGRACRWRVLWRSLTALAAVRRPPAAEPRAVLNIGSKASTTMLALEARLEHAPVALFGIDGDEHVQPLNANARKLVAPGRASDAAALYRQLAGRLHGDRSLLQFETERGTERALAAVSMLTLHGRPQRLAALMPVESELEAEALNAWRQLVHVLTHEIMNSLTPVASLSRTARDLLDEARPALPADVAADLARRSTRSAAAPTAWSISSRVTAACPTCRKRGRNGCRSPPCSRGWMRWWGRRGARAAAASRSRWSRRRWN